MTKSELGRVFSDGEIIFREGDVGDCMYVIQEGKVAVWVDRGGQQVHIATRHEGDFFGEMAIFEREARMATVRAVGRVRILTVDKKNLLRRISEDPSLAFHIIEGMSRRIRQLSVEVSLQE